MPAEVAEEFMLQYYGGAVSIPAQIVVEHENPVLARGAVVAARRRVELRAAERGDKRRLLDLAERNAKLALEQDKLKTERRRQQRVEALDGLQQALGSTRCRCGSSASTSRT